MSNFLATSGAAGFAGAALTVPAVSSFFTEAVGFVAAGTAAVIGAVTTGVDSIAIDFSFHFMYMT